MLQSSPIARMANPKVQAPALKTTCFKEPLASAFQLHSICIPSLPRWSCVDPPRPATICRDRPLGFGFRGKVQFASSELALRAIDELNGRELLGREAMQRSNGRARET